MYFAIPIRPRSRSIRPIAPKSSRSGRLKAFFDAWFKTRDGQFVAAFQSYGSTDDFAEKIEDCLRQWLAKRGLVRQEPVWDRVLRGSPFPGLEAFGADRGAARYQNGAIGW